MFRSEIGMRPKEKEWQVDVCETPARLIAGSWMFLNKATTTDEDSVSPFVVRRSVSGSDVCAQVSNDVVMNTCLSVNQYAFLCE